MVINYVRKNRSPYLVQAKVPLLNHHTSGVRKESYRSKSDLEKHLAHDPLPKLKKRLLLSFSENDLSAIEKKAVQNVSEQFAKAVSANEPDINTLEDFVFEKTPVIDETGTRNGG